MADALHYAHQNGVVHRDIKPANLLLHNNGEVYVTDFGLARIQSHEELTLTGDLLGTLRYMSPEQVDGSQHVDGRSDIYSLGLTLYELVTGRPVIQGDTRADLLRRITDHSPKRLRNVVTDAPTDLQTIIEKAIAADATERYQTAEDLSNDLRAFLDVRTIKAKPSTQLDRLRRFAKRNPVLSGSLATAFASVLLLAIVTSFWAKASAERSKQDTERLKIAKLDSRRQTIGLYAGDMQLAKQLANERKLIQLQDVLLRWVPEEGETDLRGFEWCHLWQHCEDSALVRAFDRELPTYDVKFLGDDQILSLGFSQRAKILSVHDEAEAPIDLTCNSTNLDGCDYHSGKNLIAVGDGSGTLTVWDSLTHQRVAQFDAEAGNGAQSDPEHVAFDAADSKY